MNLTSTRLTGLAAVLTAGFLALAGCGDDTDAAGHGSMIGNTESRASGSAGAEGTFADADVAFATGMIPHHRQAIEMAQLADGRAADPRVLDLAARIEAAQDPEVEMLSGWLDQWDADPMEGRGHDDMGHGAGGMMSEQDMRALVSATGAEFDRLFLEQMIAHHTGAVQMAEREIADGRNPEAMALAETIREAQTAEIAEMEQLLTQLGG